MKFIKTLSGGYVNVNAVDEICVTRDNVVVAKKYFFDNVGTKYEKWSLAQFYTEKGAHEYLDELMQRLEDKVEAN